MKRTDCLNTSDFVSVALTISDGLRDAEERVESPANLSAIGFICISVIIDSVEGNPDALKALCCILV